jgi:hypothetical protein
MVHFRNKSGRRGGYLREELYGEVWEWGLLEQENTGSILDHKSAQQVTTKGRLEYGTGGHR